MIQTRVPEPTSMGSLYKAATAERWELYFCSEILQSGSPILLK